MKTTTKTLLILLIVICLATYIVLLQREGFSAISNFKDLGEYGIYSQEKVPRREISSFTVDDDLIYIYYEAVGLVNIYTIQGEFCYGIQVGSLSNGKGDFTVKQGVLYIKCRGNGVYTFAGTTLLSFHAFEDDPEAFEAVEKLIKQEKEHQMGDQQYRLNDSGQIVKVDDTGKEYLVVSLPMQNPWTSVFLILSGLSVVLFLHLARKGLGK